MRASYSAWPLLIILVSLPSVGCVELAPSVANAWTAVPDFRLCGVWATEFRPDSTFVLHIGGLGPVNGQPASKSLLWLNGVCHNGQNLVGGIGETPADTYHALANPITVRHQTFLRVYDITGGFKGPSNLEKISQQIKSAGWSAIQLNRWSCRLYRYQFRGRALFTQEMDTKAVDIAIQSSRLTGDTSSEFSGGTTTITGDAGRLTRLLQDPHSNLFEAKATEWRPISIRK